MLLINSVRDIKKKEIFYYLTIAWGVAGLILRVITSIMNRSFVATDWLGIGVGAAFIAFSYFTGEVIGYGDGVVILALSAFVSLRNLFAILFLSFLLAGLTALVIWMIKKNRKYEMPFIPFLFLGTIIVFGGGAL